MDNITRLALITLLTDHRGKKQAIKASRLATLAQIDDTGGSPITRAMIRQIVEEDGLPIGANAAGYYWLETAEELEEYLNSLRGRIRKIAERIVMVEQNYEDHLHTEKWKQPDLTALPTSYA